MTDKALSVSSVLVHKPDCLSGAGNKLLFPHVPKNISMMQHYKVRTFTEEFPKVVAQWYCGWPEGHCSDVETRDPCGNYVQYFLTWCVTLCIFCIL